MKIALTIIKFLPELLALLKTLTELVDSGLEELKIKRHLKAIDNAFKETDAAKRARLLNDVFRGK